jgi:hypothetical protein
VLLLHSPTDLALRWQQRQDRAWEGKRGNASGNVAGGGRGEATAQTAQARAEAELRAAQLAPFHLAVNVFIYAAGKRDLRNRIDSPWVPPLASTAGSGASSSAPAPLQTVQVARLQYAGNWDPEPGSWRRFGNWFRRQTGYQLDVRPVKLSELKPGDAPFAHLTGTARHTFSPADVAALKRYVEAGGVVLVDTCGGAGPFDNGVRALLSAAFPTNYPSTIGPNHPLLNAGRPGMNEILRPRLRPYTVERLGGQAGALGLVRAGRGHVVVTNLDVTTGLLGTGTWGILGYEPDACMALMENAIFWTLDGQPDRPLPASTADADGE